MVTIYNNNKKKLVTLYGIIETKLREICENSIDVKTNKKLFNKIVNNEIGKIMFISLSSTEVKFNINNIGNIYLWKDYVLIFEVS